MKPKATRNLRDHNKDVEKELSSEQIDHKVHRKFKAYTICRKPNMIKHNDKKIKLNKSNICSYNKNKLKARNSSTIKKNISKQTPKQLMKESNKKQQNKVISRNLNIEGQNVQTIKLTRKENLSRHKQNKIKIRNITRINKNKYKPKANIYWINNAVGTRHMEPYAVVAFNVYLECCNKLQEDYSTFTSHDQMFNCVFSIWKNMTDEESKSFFECGRIAYENYIINDQKLPPRNMLLQTLSEQYHREKMMKKKKDQRRRESKRRYY